MVICSFSIHRFYVFENELYIKVISKENYFNFCKHVASKKIIQKFKEKKNNTSIKYEYVTEGPDYLLYKNDSDVLRIIQLNNNQIEDIVYKPKFNYKIEGEYVTFIFNDDLLCFVDEIVIQLKIHNNDEKHFYSIPINTRISECMSIIQIQNLEELNLSILNFEIEHTFCYKNKL